MWPERGSRRRRRRSRSLSTVAVRHAQSRPARNLLVRGVGCPPHSPDQRFATWLGRISPRSWLVLPAAACAAGDGARLAAECLLRPQHPHERRSTPTGSRLASLRLAGGAPRTRRRGAGPAARLRVRPAPPVPADLPVMVATTATGPDRWRPCSELSERCGEVVTSASRGFRPKHFRRPDDDERSRVPPGQYVAKGFAVSLRGRPPTWRWRLAG
jgi:hypothetical protein